MFRKPVLGKMLSFLLLMALPVVQLHAQQYAGSNRELQPNQTQEMTVVGGQPTTPTGPGYFTVVGGVQRSGVYTSDEPQVPIATLIKAAGGLSGERSVAVRILSGFRPPVQHFFDGTNTETLRPSEILVVSEQPTTNYRTGEATPNVTVPIVCLGLIERPVVLPLHPDVVDVPTLIHNLNQSQEILPYVQHIHPAGHQGEATLYSGSLVIFTERTFDPRRLNQNNQFPPAVALTAALKAVEQPAAPRTTEAMPLPAIDLPAGYAVRDFTQEQNAAAQPPALPPLPGFTATTPTEIPAALPAPATTSVTAGAPGTVTIERPESLSTQPPLATPTLSSPQMPLSAPQLQLPGSVVQTSSHADLIEEPAPAPVAPSAMLTPEPEPTLADALPAAPQTTPSEAAGTMLAPAPVESPIVTMPELNRSEFSANESVATPLPPRGNLLPVAFAVGVLTLLCLGACIVWSRYDNLAFQNAHVAPAATDTNTVSPTIDATPVPVAPPVLPSRTAINDVIDQVLPLVEEPVRLPQSVPLHGEAVGHRKLVLHPAHETVPAPKFASRRTTPQRERVATHSERELRSHLRSMLANFPDATAANSSGTDTYDVVQPETETAKFSPTVEGPLERALKALAGEHQS